MMRKTMVEEIVREKKEEIRTTKKAARLELDREREHRERVEQSLTGKDHELIEARRLLEEKDVRDLDMIRRWAEDAVRYERRAVRWERGLFVGVALVLAVGGWVLDTNTIPGYAGLIAWVMAAITFFLAVGPIFPWFPNVLRPWIIRGRDRRFMQRIEEAGREDLLGSYDIDWQNVSVRKRQRVFASGSTLRGVPMARAKRPRSRFRACPAGFQVGYVGRVVCGRWTSGARVRRGCAPG